MNIGNLPPMHGNLLREHDDDIMIYPSELGAQHFQTRPVLQRTMEISPATKKQGTAGLVVSIHPRNVAVIFHHPPKCGWKKNCARNHI